jgi:transcription antitermination factor NusG
MIDDNIERFWFALYTKPRHEFKAESQLNLAMIQNYLPAITKLKQWSDRKKKITEPLLRGYIFILADEKERLQALEQQSIVRCVCERGRPAKIPEDQIENLRKFIREERDYIVHDGLIKGSRIRIKEGPFKDVEGVIIEEPGKKSIAVSIDLLNRTVITHITDDNIIEVLQSK